MSLKALVRANRHFTRTKLLNLTRKYSPNLALIGKMRQFTNVRNSVVKAIPT
ncbi:MAG: hypothetical protein OFPII_27460 [Osedax symbiont Rs1]|nr:MAG: hypothetical protein OFPII_27460 [Osedax symbiont Rs1]